MSIWGLGSWSLAFHAASLPSELSCLFVMQDELKTWLINEPSRDKTCLQDFPPGPNTNQAVHPQNMTIGLKFRNQEVEELYFKEFNFVATASLKFRSVR